MNNRIQSSSHQDTWTTVSLNTEASGWGWNRSHGWAILTSHFHRQPSSFLLYFRPWDWPLGKSPLVAIMQLGEIVGKWSIYKDKYRFIDHLTVKTTWNQVSLEGKHIRLRREESNIRTHVQVHRAPSILCTHEAFREFIILVSQIKVPGWAAVGAQFSMISGLCQIYKLSLPGDGTKESLLLYYLCRSL